MTTSSSLAREPTLQVSIELTLPRVPPTAQAGLLGHTPDKDRSIHSPPSDHLRTARAFQASTCPRWARSPLARRQSIRVLPILPRTCPSGQARAPDDGPIRRLSRFVHKSSQEVSHQAPGQPRTHNLGKCYSRLVSYKRLPFLIGLSNVKVFTPSRRLYRTGRSG